MNNKSYFLIPISALLLSSSVCAQVLTLSQAYSLALKNEPKLKAMQYKVEAVKETQNQSFSRLLPQVQSSGSWGSYDYDADYLPESVKEDYLSYSISVNQAIYRPEYVARVDEDKARAMSAQYDYKTEAHRLAFDVAKRYFEYTLSLKNVELTQSQYEYYKTKHTQLQEMLKVGLSTRVDVLEAKVRSDEAFSILLNEKKKLNIAKLGLEYFIGEHVDEVATLDFNTIDLGLFTLDKGALEEKMPNNPLVKSSYYNTQVAQHELSLREYGHYPTVDMSISRKGQDTSDRLAHTYDNQAVVQVNIPLYQGGATQSRIAEGMKLLDASLKEYEHVQKDNQLKFETLWSDRPLLIEKILHLRESQISAELYVASMEKAYTAGLKSIVDLLDAKAKLYIVKRDLATSGSELVNNHASLLDLAGELTPQRIEEFERNVASR